MSLVRAGASAGFLASPLADVASLLLFALAGRVAADLFPLGPPAMRELTALVFTCMGPLGVAIERGAARPVGARAAALFGLGAALAHVAARALPPFALLGWRPSPPTWVDGVAALVALVVGAAGSRLGPRLDRGEEGWRAALRAQPPDGSSPLAWRIAASGLPRPLALLLLPIELPVRLAILLSIRLYQLTASRLMPPACRFEPTCSRYGFEAVCTHGAARGTLLTGLRLLRCSPISDGGHDPVPPARDAASPAEPTPGRRMGEVSSSAVERSP